MKSYSDNKVFQVLGLFGDLILLNVLWIVCSLPIVTIGASTTALYYTTLKLVRNEESYLTKMFFRSFRQNLKQGIQITLFLLLFCVILYLDHQIAGNTEIAFGPILSILFLVFACVLVMTASYAFPLLAQFDNTVKGTLKNALFMSVWHLPYTLVIVLLHMVPVVLFYLAPLWFVMSLIVWMVIGVAGVAYLNSRLFVKIFDCYISADDSDGDILEMETEN